MGQSEDDFIVLGLWRKGKNLTPTVTSFRGQETYLFHPIVCVGCLIKTCEQHSTVCANCGEIVLPYSQVGVLERR